LPYLAILERLLQAVAGAQAALLLDPSGEVVVQAGERDFRHRLIGAYQGIALGAAQRGAERAEVGRIGQVSCRYDQGTVVLTSLKDGYYLVVSLATGVSPASGQWHSAEARLALDAEL
jgi:predicted regulator of Ras-like GTPase activity (Roadblock/LC7/MglB family)